MIRWVLSISRSSIARTYVFIRLVPNHLLLVFVFPTRPRQPWFIAVVKVWIGFYRRLCFPILRRFIICLLTQDKLMCITDFQNPFTGCFPIEPMDSIMQWSKQATDMLKIFSFVLMFIGLIPMGLSWTFLVMVYMMLIRTIKNCCIFCNIYHTCQFPRLLYPFRI